MSFYLCPGASLSLNLDVAPNNTARDVVSAFSQIYRVLKRIYRLFIVLDFFFFRNSWMAINFIRFVFFFIQSTFCELDN